jgi:hypothetical protein
VVVGWGIVGVYLDGELAVSERFFHVPEPQEHAGQADMKGRAFRSERQGPIEVRQCKGGPSGVQEREAKIMMGLRKRGVQDENAFEDGGGPFEIALPPTSFAEIREQHGIFRSDHEQALERVARLLETPRFEEQHAQLEEGFRVLGTTREKLAIK